jgi:uncharacterized membrane protein
LPQPDDAGGDAEQDGTPPVSMVPDPDIERIAGMLPPEEASWLIRIIRTHVGPLPSPETLAGYRELLPDAPERLVRIVEAEQEHRHAIERNYHDRDFRLKERGQIFALIAMVLVLLFAGYLAWLGNTGTAGAVAMALVAAVVGIFVTGKVVDRKMSKDQED